jgi:hypothetical protein
MLDGPQNQSGHYGEEKNLALAGIELGPYSPQPVARIFCIGEVFVRQQASHPT